MQDPLPIDAHLERIVATVRTRRHAIVVAPPGAGKTTRVPPALLPFGPVILLQPRRIAARSLARRIAQEQSWTIGEEVGWQVRFDRRFGAKTRLLVATEGILTARLQADPLLSEFAVVVIDEFHERSLHADLALALARQAALARDDLRIVVMSATLDAVPVSEFLGGCPVVEVQGRPYPVTVEHASATSAAAAVRTVLSNDGGHVLVFLPGAPEIRRVHEELRSPSLPATILPLHGSLDADDQDRALAPSVARKVILATNLAETSLTVEGVTDVIDSGLHKVLRFDPTVALDRLVTERISLDAADQRAGRAGRTAPGRALRLWDPRALLAAHRESEIARVDLAGPLLEILAWGADPLRFDWFEPPPRERMEAAIELLQALGAVVDRRVSALGAVLRRFPLHPRLARVLVDAGGTPKAAAACAVLAEGWAALHAGEVSCDSDVLARAEAIGAAPHSVRAAASQLASMAAQLLDGKTGDTTDEGLLRALLAGYPDRVAKRRAPGSPRVVLCSGHGAALARESGVRSGEWLVAADVQASSRRGQDEALVRAASLIDPSWLAPSRRTIEHELQSGKVRAHERSWYGALVLSERPVAPDLAEAARLLADAVRARGLGDAERALLRRVRFAGIELDENAWIARACEGKTSLEEMDLTHALPGEMRRDLDRLAPETISLPSGRRARLDYREDGTLAASVKLQELFGLAETPRVGPRRELVTLLLLAPNGRPVQTTRDLRSFWDGVYPEVRKQLRARYPKHRWPEDPWSAAPGR